MSIVIIGGHDRMIRRYKEICESFNCKYKIFTHMKTDLSDKIGSPDLLVLFTGTMSHKMLRSACSAASKNSIKTIHCRTGSSGALTNILSEHCR